MQTVNRGFHNIKSCAANCDQGIKRKYNEDRATVILNIFPLIKGIERNWSKCSFFGIYDGHGGSGCSTYMSNHLHNYVINNENFPSKPKEALKKGF